MSIEKDSVNVRTMGSDVKAAIVLDKHNEEYVEDEVFPKNINDLGDLDSQASSHPKVNKGQDTVANAYREVPEYLDAYSSFIPEVPEYHVLIGARYRY